MARSLPSCEATFLVNTINVPEDSNQHFPPFSLPLFSEIKQTFSCEISLFLFMLIQVCQMALQVKPP